MVNTNPLSVRGERTPAFISFEEEWSLKVNDGLTGVSKLDIFHRLDQQHIPEIGEIIQMINLDR